MNKKYEDRADTVELWGAAAAAAVAAVAPVSAADCEDDDRSFAQAAAARGLFRVQIPDAATTRAPAQLCEADVNYWFRQRSDDVTRIIPQLREVEVWKSAEAWQVFGYYSVAGCPYDPMPISATAATFEAVVAELRASITTDESRWGASDAASASAA